MSSKDEKFHGKFRPKEEKSGESERGALDLGKRYGKKKGKFLKGKKSEALKAKKRDGGVSGAKL